MITCVCDICGYSKNPILANAKLYEINIDNKRIKKRKIHICENCMNQIAKATWEKERENE